METLKVRYTVMTALLLLTGLIVKSLSYGIYYKTDVGLEQIDEIPHRIGAWQGQDVALEEGVYEILETRAIINRRYASQGSGVFLSIVHYPETKVDFHVPTGCLAGKGIEISKSKKQIAFAYQDKEILLDMNQLVRKKDHSNELIYYFYKSGPFLGSSYLKLRLMLAIRKFSRGSKSGSLIRVSSSVKMDPHAAEERLKRFIEGLYPHMMKAL